jgi:RND family efflux transporter MFP subunit
LSQQQSSLPNDRLASLRIDRGPATRTSAGWLGTVIKVGLVLGPAAALGYWGWQQYGESLSRPQVKVGVVEARLPGDADAVLTAHGYLKSERQAAIGAKVPGRVLKVHVREGQPVAASAVLAELEHADLDESLKAMKASLDAQEASLQAMRVGLEKAKSELAEIEETAAYDEREFIRAAELVRSRANSPAEFEAARSKRTASRSRRDAMAAAVAIAQARLREAEARRRESEARHAEAQQQRDYMFIRAPFPGVVISKEAEDGESIMPGGLGAASGRGAVVTLADLLHLEVDTDVKEDYLGRVKKNQRVSIAVAAVPNTRFAGRVRTIIPMGDRAKGTVKVKVRLDEEEVRRVNNPQTESFTLFPEMAATVHFLSEGKSVASGQVVPQLLVPQSAVQTDANGKFVWQVVDDRLKRRPIEIGEPLEGRVLIRSGVAAGERIVLEPGEGLREDLLIKVAP